MKFLRVLCWIKCRIADWLCDLKNGCSRYVIGCICSGGIVESGAKVYSQFPGTIRIGCNVKIGRHSVISNYDKPGFITIGSGTSIGWGNSFYGMGGIEIGRKVLFASNVFILTANHGWQDLNVPIMDQECTYAPVFIGDDSWIGCNVTILPGVRIGRHVVIGANSVVTHDMPDDSVCAGNPCKVIKMLRTGESAKRMCFVNQS